MLEQPQNSFSSWRVRSNGVYLAIVVFAIAIFFSLWTVWQANAAVTEASIVDLTASTGVNSVKPSAVIAAIKFSLSPNANDRIASTSFQIINVTGTTHGDFNTDNSVVGGNAVFLATDNNNNGTFDFGTDTSIGTLKGSLLAVGSTSTIDVDTDSNPGNGFQSALVTTTPYLLVFRMSSTSTDGHIFKVKFSSGTTTYTVTSTLITSVGLTTGNITVDATAPTVSVSMPPDGQQFVPVDAFIKATFNEALATSTVTTTVSGLVTSTVLLQANMGNTQGGGPGGANLCNTVTPISGPVVTCTHSSLATSTWYSFSLTPGITDVAGNKLAVTSTVSFKTGDFAANSNVTPPAVMGTVPTNGSTSFPTNGLLYVEFPASLAGTMKLSGTGSIVSADNVVLQITTNGVPSGSNLLTDSNLGFLATGVTDPHWLRITPSSLTASTNYALTVKKTAQNFNGVPMNNDFVLFFKTAAGTDSTAPTFSGMSPASSTTGVALNVGDVAAQFSEDMTGSLITTTSLRLFIDSNTNFKLDAGESIAVSTTVRYDSQQHSAHIGVKTVLTANKQYCVEAATTLTDLVGNALTKTTRCFTTTPTAYVATSPTITYADADNFKLWISFDQPIDPIDAVNLANYTLESPVGVTVNLTNATFNYRPEGKGVEVTGIGLVTGQQYKLTATGIHDLSLGAAITADGTSNVAKGVVQDSSKTGGIVGGLDKGDESMKNFADQAQHPQRCAPNSTIVGKSSRFTCEFQTPASLATGSKIILTFPTGFSINNTSLITAASSPMNADINGFGPGVTTISSMATNTIANTITLTLAHSGTAMGSLDQLRFELDSITNNQNPGLYSVSMIVLDANGVKQGQVINPMQFFVQAGGALSISGKVCKGSSSGGTCGGGDTGIQNAKVFLDSPASGHQEATTASDGAYSFTSLTVGQYNIGVFIDPSVSSDLGGGTNFQGVNITSTAATGVDFKKTDVSSTGKTLTVTITGGPASTDMDIFCFAPNNVQSSAPIRKKVTTNGSGAASETLKVQPSTTYRCNVGPHIPFDSISSGVSPTMPTVSFVQPAPNTIVVGTTDLSTSFTLTVATQQIIGKVTDGSGTAVTNVGVSARPLGCFDTTSGVLKDCGVSQTVVKSDGTYVLNVTAGTYQVEASSPGMPPTAAVEVTVKVNSSNSDNNTAADVYTGGTLVTSANGIVFKMNKTGITISGQVLDDSGNAMKYAFVQAKKVGTSDTCTSFTYAGSETGSPTDSSGNYTLYVSNGTWRVEAYAGMYGQVNCSIITVSGDTSKSSQNIQATASSYGTISGTVTKAGTVVQGAQVNCFSTSGGNQTVSGADGTFSLKVKTGTYRCDGSLSGSGPLTPATGVVVTSAGTTSVTLTIGNPATITVVLGSTVTDAFCEARDSSGLGSGTNQNSSGTYTLNVPAGTYTVRCGNPQIGQIGSESVVVTAGGTKTVTFTPPTLFAVTGSVTDGTNNLEGASVTFTDKSNGRSLFKQSDATLSGANVSVSLPAGTYAVAATKSGYVDSASSQTLTVSAATTFTTRSLTKATATATATVQASGSNYTGNARVFATRASDSKKVVVSIDNTVTSGANASLPLVDGTWSVFAMGDNGKQSSAATVVVSGSSADTSPTLSLSTSISGFTAVQTQQSMAPSDGGLFKDANIDSKFELNIPTGAASQSDSTAGTIETKTDATLAISTPGKTFLGTSAIGITLKDSNGYKLTGLQTAATIKIPYSEADIPAGISESQLQCATWNETTSDWETLSTTVDTDNNVLTCATTHFSTFGAVAPSSGGTNASSNTTSNSTSSGGGGGSPSISPVVTSNSVQINSGKSVTTNRNVTLTFDVKKVTEMAISNTADFKDSKFVPYAPSSNWVLPEGNGTKTVYVKFRTNSGGITTEKISITLNNQATEQIKTDIPSKTIVPFSPATMEAFYFTKQLGANSKGADVVELQKLLRKQGYFTNPKDTGVLDKTTADAVKKFQKANKLSQLGTVGPATLKALNATNAPVKVEAPKPTSEIIKSAPSVVRFTKQLGANSKGTDVVELQKVLRKLGYFTYPTDTGTYGSSTRDAVKKFQKANKLSQLGTVGPATLKALNAVK